MTPLLFTPRRLSLLLALTTTAALGACASDAAEQRTTDTPYAGVIDSALPIPELLARFRATVSDTPTTLAGGAPSADALARELLAAVSARDTVAVRGLLLSRAEFAWLYYPHARYTAPPYELGPELVWFTSSAASEKGAARLLARFGGRPLRFEQLVCPDSTDTEGPNVIQRGCVVRFAPGDSAVRELQLFGALLRRDGRYKFLSYANDL